MWTFWGGNCILPKNDGSTRLDEPLMSPTLAAASTSNLGHDYHGAEQQAKRRQGSSCAPPCKRRTALRHTIRTDERRP
jgi:hypothetical protein